MDPNQPKTTDPNPTLEKQYGSYPTRDLTFLRNTDPTPDVTPAPTPDGTPAPTPDGTPAPRTCSL